MDEEITITEDLVADDASFSDDVDSEYEFDAYQFFDFTRGETQSEAEEAESWFRYAHEYPPSPFIVKLKLMKAAKADPMKVHKTSSRKIEANKAASKDTKIKGVKHHNHIPQDNKSKSKPTVNLSKPSGSSFMKPTASHLAKQNKECDIHSGGYGRLQKPLVSAAEKLRSPIRFQNQTTKRQKLEIGYLRKAAQLKHRASFLHKISEKALQLESSSNSRVKTTIPKKPTLVTEERAQRRMSQSKSEFVQVQHPKANTQASKPRPLNKKILDSHSNKDKSRSPNNLKICNSDKVHPIKDGGFTLNAKHDSHLPPTELFKKLSLKPEPEAKVTSSLKPPHLNKGLKENVPRSYEQEFRRFAGKPNHCGPGRKIAAVKYSPTLTGA